MMGAPNRVAELFIRIAQQKDACWKAHINRKPREALEQATLLVMSTHELQKLLAEKVPAGG